MPLTPATRLGPYEIIAPLGAGGMGEVYRARDTRLKRDIAIKVLPHDVASSPDRLARFEREATTVAGLNHPNIVVLYSIEEAQGTRFLTMELVEGRSLDQSVSPGGLPAARVIELGIALADALAAAHEKGVIHRDLKPANVMVTKDGRVKVLDFGLAKLAASDSNTDLTRAATMTTPLSAAGQVVGTVPYMAPEQIRGGAVDARTDLFALGVVLYELASGKRPFTGDTHADIASTILRDTPKPLGTERDDLPPDLHRIVGRCLEKNPRERFQTALDVSNELRGLRKGLERSESGTPARPASQAVASIAVLPFVNRSANVDDEYFSDGLADELINVLARIRGVRVAARTSAFHFKGKDATIPEVGRALNVATVLEGSVRKSGQRARISVQLVNVADGYPLWSGTYDRTLDDMFAVQDDIAQSVVNELRSTLLGEQPNSQARDDVKVDLSAAPGAVRPADPEVYDLYLRGRHQLNRRGHESLHRAIAFFEAAIVRDPAYAMAHLGLAEAHGLVGFHEFQAPGEAFPRARAAAEQALAVVPDLGEAHAVLGYVTLHFDRNWSAAERQFLQAIELNPNHAVTRLWYANLLLAAARFDEALEQGRRALVLDPLSIINNLVTGWIHFFEGRFDVAYDKMVRALELEPTFFQAHHFRGWALWGMGKLGEAAPHMDTAAQFAQYPPTVLINRALAAAFAGHVDKCLETVAHLVAMRNERYVSAFYIAIGLIMAGETAQAEPWIERAADERSPWINFLNVDPRMSAMRARPRIQAILADLGRGA
jgi:serine/threonine protein kinase/tetratricopeptide (TPR) repeat protein